MHLYKTISIAVVIASIPTSLAAQIPLEKPVLASKTVVGPAGPKPTELRAEVSPTSIRLRWACVTGPTGYEVYATPKGGAMIKLTATPMSPQCIQDLSLVMNKDPRLPAPTASTYLSSYTHTGLAVGTEYTYVVRALYASGYADSDPLTSQTHPWYAPVALGATLVGRSASLRWNAIDGATGYLVFRKLEGQPAFQQITAAPTPVASYSDPSSLPPGEHRYYVQAVNGLPADPVSVSVGPWPAPESFAVAIAGKAATLTWKPVAGATGYLVFRQLHGEPAFQQITPAPVSATSFQSANLPPAQQHGFYVQAVNGVASPAVTVLSGRPVGLAPIVYRGKETVDFRWTGTEGATPLMLRGTAPAGPFVPPTGKLPVQYLDGWARDSHASVGATQYYKFIFTYPTGVVESDVMEAKILAPPQGVANLAASSPGPGTVLVTWTCDPEATSYSYFRRKESSTVIESSKQLGNVCNFTETGLWNDATYLYVVSAAYPERNTNASSSVYIKIAP